MSKKYIRMAGGAEKKKLFKKWDALISRTNALTSLQLVRGLFVGTVAMSVTFLVLAGRSSGEQLEHRPDGQREQLRPAAGRLDPAALVRGAASHRPQPQQQHPGNGTYARRGCRRVCTAHTIYRCILQYVCNNDSLIHHALDCRSNRQLNNYAVTFCQFDR